MEYQILKEIKTSLFNEKKFSHKYHPKKKESNKTVRSLSSDNRFSKIFSTFKEVERLGLIINAFKEFTPIKPCHELYMPVKKPVTGEISEKE